jgi:hypothetical protein
MKTVIYKPTFFMVKIRDGLFLGDRHSRTLFSNRSPITRLPTLQQNHDNNKLLSQLAENSYKPNNLTELARRLVLVA